MVVQLRKVQLERWMVADEMVMEEGDVDCWAKPRREPAVDEQSMDGQASFVEDAEYATELEWQVVD